MEIKKITAIKPVFLYLASVVFGLLIAYSLFRFFAPSPASLPLKTAQPPTKPNPVTQAPPQQLPQTQPQPSQSPELPALTLNGIFFSGEDGYCLINNQILKVGDAIQGLVVEKIKEQEVELSNKGAIIKLSLFPTQQDIPAANP